MMDSWRDGNCIGHGIARALRQAYDANYYNV